MTPRATTILLFALSITLACSVPETTGQFQTEYDPETGRLSQLTYDSDKDGRADIWNYMDGTKLISSEIDSDRDGVVDRWEYFGPDRQLEKVGLSRANDGIVDSWLYEAADGSVSRVEVSTRRDGTANRTEFYEQGELVRAEEDSNTDGHIDKWETFQEGVLKSVSFDTVGAGHPTRRLVYGADGNLERIENAEQP